MKKEDAAFPVFCGNEHSAAEGMSKRFYAACAAMQGIMAGHYSVFNGNTDSPVESVVVKYAYDLADELLKQENAT